MLNKVLSIALALLMAFLMPGQALALTRSEVIGGGSSELTSEAILDITGKANGLNLSGAEYLEKYLNGDGLTTEEFLSIDAEVLEDVDQEIAEEISSYQQFLTKVPEEGTGDSEGEPSDGSDEDATPTPDPSDETATVDPKDEAADSTESKDTADTKESDDVNKDAETDDANPTENPTEENTNQAATEVIPSSEGSSTATPSRAISPTLSTDKFIAVIGEQAREVAAENNLYASVMIAQAILESASGNSELASAPYFNLFGIKGTHKGQSVVMRTGEDDGTGNIYYISARFRAYDSIRDSLEDYANLLTKQMGGFYHGVTKTNAVTCVDACNFLQGRYATSTTYSESLQALIDAYNLERFDTPLAYEEVETHEIQAQDEETGELLFDEKGEPVMEERTLVDLAEELTSHLGEDYVWGGSTCGSFDCSGLVQYCYREAMGISLPRIADAQASSGTKVTMQTEQELLKEAGTAEAATNAQEAADAAKAKLVEVDFDALHLGDLVCFADEDGYVYHIGVYLGEGCYIQAPHPGSVVQVTSLAESEPTFAVRLVDVQERGQNDIDESSEILRFSKLSSNLRPAKTWDELKGLSK